MPTKRPPRETNELASYILRVTTGEEEKIKPRVKNIHAVNLAELGASKGGKARAKKLSPRKRKQIAKAAAKKRWSQERKG